MCIYSMKNKQKCAFFTSTWLVAQSVIRSFQDFISYSNTLEFTFDWTKAPLQICLSIVMVVFFWLFPATPYHERRVSRIFIAFCCFVNYFHFKFFHYLHVKLFALESLIAFLWQKIFCWSRHQNVFKQLKLLSFAYLTFY